MITKFKIFENKKDPEIGYYVICEDELLTNDNQKYKDTIEFLKNNVGQIVSKIENNKYNYIVYYENVPKNSKLFGEPIELEKNCRLFSKNEIKKISKNKEKLEIKISIKKYNL